ncbi:hypothetical protein FBU31_001944 [Coemansia sp. 'formosensis']|nr:hypothetical protein FBU31_001944 [Coemansia sp. 'formosensis']
MLIARKVVAYLECRPKVSFDYDADKYNKNKAVLVPLVSVSERWRTAALESICDNCKIDFDHYRRAVEVTYPAWSNGYSYPQLRKNSLAKSVAASAALWKGMCDGKFCKIIAMPQYEGLVFSSASILFLRLNPYLSDVLCNSNNCGYKPSDPVLVTSQEIVAGFVRSLLRLTPAVTSVVVIVQTHRGMLTEYVQLYETLISELYRGDVKNLQAYSSFGFREMPSLGSTTGLTTIKQGQNIPCAPFIRLAYINAGTLVTLEIQNVKKVDWLALIYDGTDTPTIYADLTWLTLTIVDAPYTETWAAIEGLAPFPILKTLDVRNAYPFDDDLLFRGNGGTLQSCRVPFRAIATNAFSRFNILKRSGITKMNKIRIGAVSDEGKAFVAANAGVQIEQQVHNILEVAATLKLDNDTTDLRMFCTLRAAPSTAIIQYLELPNFKCTPDDIIQLVAALPSLVSRTCEVRGTATSIATIPTGEQPESIRAKYSPLNSNFKKLSVPWDADSVAESIAHVAITLAVVCPNFVYVDISPKLRHAFLREVAWATLHRHYEPYGDSLLRLVYKYWMHR